MSVQIRNPELVRLLAADFVTRRELVTTPGNRITLTNTDLIVSGGGALTLSAAGAYTLTVPKTGTVPVGTGTAGRIAEWVTDANTVQASTLAKTGAGVLTLSAAGAYTLTVPATGTAALLGTANVFTAAQTVNGNLLVSGIVLARGSDGRLGFENPSGDTAIYLRNNGASTQRKLEILYGSTVVASIENTRHLLIGTTTDGGQVAIDQASTTAAIPVLYLDQGDVSEDLIEIVAGSATGNATTISTDAAGAYAGRIQITVNGTRRWLNFYADA